ncbi:MAG: class I SAM-dependent methyltransferase [Solirubrobacteraceae bacterium]
MRSPTRDLAFVVRSLRNAAHTRVFAMTSEAATTWGVGEYALIAERLAPAAQEVVDLAEVTHSDRVLDVACGTGNAALFAARRGATVVGLDFEPILLEIAKARAREDGLDIEWMLADLQSAPLERAAFTVVLSAFGVMYASDHDAAAAALARCSAPGARLALAAWVPGSFMPAMGAALAPYLPPPPGGTPPSRSCCPSPIEPRPSTSSSGARATSSSSSRVLSARDAGSSCAATWSNWWPRGIRTPAPQWSCAASTWSSSRSVISGAGWPTPAGPRRRPTRSG